MKLSEERSELAAMDIAALRERLVEAKRSLWTARFALGKRQLENTATLQKSRKTIARINMYIALREREAAEAAALSGGTLNNGVGGASVNG